MASPARKSSRPSRAPENPYLQAVSSIPRGATRSFLEIAALAGKPGAARAVGRAWSQVPEDSPRPWHRVVAADGRPKRDPGRPRRNELQWKRLRREGARPRQEERIPDWLARVGARYVGDYRKKEYVRASDPRARGYRPEQVEPFASEAEARARGFSPPGETGASEPLPVPGFAQVAPRGMDMPLPDRLARLSWERALDHLRDNGFCRFPGLLSPAECASMIHESTDPSRFERSVAMFPKGYGVGSYHYYREPLPEPAATLRRTLYSELRPLALQLWPQGAFPETLDQFWESCRAQGQMRSSSILICYGEGGVNHPHRDIYGRVWFPFQALVMLAKRGRDFEGGQFVLFDEIEGAKPREIPVSEGDVTIFTTRERFEGRRKIGVRHGMSPVTKGKRYGLGMVFHLAE